MYLPPSQIPIPVRNAESRGSYGASLVAQMVKNPPAMQETWIPSLDGGEPLEKGMAAHSSVPAWRIPWTEKPGELQAKSWT